MPRTSPDDSPNSRQVSATAARNAGVTFPWVASGAAPRTRTTNTAGGFVNNHMSAAAAAITRTGRSSFTRHPDGSLLLERQFPGAARFGVAVPAHLLVHADVIDHHFHRERGRLLRLAGELASDRDVH